MLTARGRAASCGRPPRASVLERPFRAHVALALRVLLVSLLAAAGTTARAQTPIGLFESFVGRFNYEATGGSLRSQPNTSDACALNPSSTALLQGVPATATIRAAYLYWAGSGSTPDATVTFNGVSVSASRSFTEIFPINATDIEFFAGFADVTALVAGNGVQSFGGLSVDNGSPYCGLQAVLAGWALIVVYEDATEDLRAVNVFDGFELFRAESITLSVDTFRIPAAPVNGKVTHITWEGDPQNSGQLSGFSESLSFNGTPIDDGLVPPGSMPAVQQFDSTVNTLGITTSYGVDVDTYDVSALLNPGDTSAATTYSAGADLVLLSAEVISFTTEPVADLSISKTHAGDFTVGTTGDYVIRVTNQGPEPETNAITGTDTLPAGLVFVGGTGTDWTCSAVGADVTCTHPGPLPVGASAPDLTLTVQVGVAAAPAVTNTAAVLSPSLDNDASNDQSSDPTTVLASELSSSTKSVVDVDGGDADAGDVLRYTITLRESAGIDATGVSVTDDLPALVTGFNLVSLPAGATDASTGAGTGANGTGFLDIRDIVVAAGTSADVVFEVTIAGGASPGAVIANQATVTNPLGGGAAPVAPDVIVSQSQVPAGGTKTLYLFDAATPDPNGFDEGPAPYLSRTPPVVPQSDVAVDRNGPPRIWTLTPSLQASLTIDAGAIPVTLYVSKGGANGGASIRTLTVALATTGAVTGPLGTPVTQTFSAPPSGSPDAVTFNVSLAAVTVLPAGTQITLTLTNATSGGGTQRVRVFPTTGAYNSRIDLPALTVIRVDTLTSLDAAYPGGAAQTVFTPGATAALRAEVSDPFGVFDVASVVLDVTDALGAPVITAQPMPSVAAISGSAAVYEYLLNLPAGAASGLWTYRVTAIEGTEATVTHQRSGTFSVGGASLTVTKSVAVQVDPVNGATNPKAVPGATMLYTLSVANSGSAPIDGDSLVLVDALPAGTALYVDTGGGDPIVFVEGTPASGLTYDYSTDVSYSAQPGGGPPYGYTPVADADGYDPAVTGIRVNPRGALAGDSGAGAPGFTLRYRLRID